MNDVTITITRDEEVQVNVLRGTHLHKNGKDYVLYIGKDGNVNKAALVNIRTGEAIHTLKEVACNDCVSAAELTTLNFTKSSAVVAY